MTPTWDALVAEFKVWYVAHPFLSLLLITLLVYVFIGALNGYFINVRKICREEIRKSK